MNEFNKALGILRCVTHIDESMQKLFDEFDDAYKTDDEEGYSKFRRLSRTYLDNIEQQELIDDIFITLCGFSFKTLVERSTKRSVK